MSQESISKKSINSVDQTGEENKAAEMSKIKKLLTKM